MARQASRQRSRRDGGGRRQPPWRRLAIDDALRDYIARRKREPIAA